MIDPKLVKKINNINWYRQGGSILPYYPSMPFQAAFRSFDGFNFFKGKHSYAYFDKDKERKIIDKIIKKQVKDGNYIINDIIKPWHSLSIKQDNFVKNINPSYLSKLSEKEFYSIHKEFSKLRHDMWKIGVLIEAFDPWGDAIVNEFLNKYKLKIEPDDLAVFVGSRKLTFVQKELLDRLNIAKKLKQGKNIKQLLSNHVKKYHWVHNTWADVFYLDEKYFMKLIKEDSQKSIDLIDDQIKELQNHESKIKQKLSSLFKKYTLPEEIKNIFYFFSNMTDWRDERKGRAMRISYTADMFLHELSKRTKIHHKYLIYLDACEVESTKYIKSIEKDLKQRPNGYIYCLDGTKIKCFVGKEAFELHDLLEKSLSSAEIKGTIANKGIVKGYVRIIVHNKDFEKINKGDILVTQMTRPEFTPIIHKAAAVITDEGGITCHAAIVSRELGIPCIIGTQTATSVLHDGDLVEVDANHGVVKILK